MNKISRNISFANTLAP